MKKSDNFFDEIRIALALIVIFAHQAVLTGHESLKIFEKIFDADFAVKGFFAISGYLVMQSYKNSRTITQFAEKRVRRITPAYLAAITLCIILGAFFTTLSLPDFFTNKQTIDYIFWNSIFLNFKQPMLPNVFQDNIVQAMNGSLWTIKIEIMLYACIPLLSALYKRIGIKTATLLIFTASLAWSIYFTMVYKGAGGEELARQFPGQLTFFALGAFLGTTEKKNTALPWLSLSAWIIVALNLKGIPPLIAQPIAYATLVITLATQSRQHSALSRLSMGRFGDISYGLYLYHFPVIQTLIFLGVYDKHPALGVAAAVILTSMLSVLSWHLIEKRTLKRSSHYIKAEKALAP